MSHESGTLPAEGVRTMFDRIAPVYDLMNRVMTVGLDQRWRRLTVREVVKAGDRVLDGCCGTGDLAVAARKAGAGEVDRSRLLAPDARARAAEGAGDRVDPGRPARAAVRGCVVRRRDGRVRRSQRRRPRARARRAAADPEAGRPHRHPRDHEAERAAEALLPALVRRADPARGQDPPRWQGLHVPPGERAPLPRPGRAGRADARARLRRGRLSPPRRRDRRAPHRDGCA